MSPDRPPGSPVSNSPATDSSAPAARDAMALALDMPDPAQALSLAKELAPHFAVAKVGLELFCAAGPQVIMDLQAAGFAVFADLKLHDIPNTVRKAAQQIGRLRVSFLTIHTSGGAEMLAAGVKGLHAGAAELDAGADPARPAPAALGVTVLTSTAIANQDELQSQLTERARLASQAGCAGVICAAADIATVNQATANQATPSHLLKVVPGVRPAGTAADDQARVATPGDAIAAGADLLVIGRAVTAAPDPAAAATAIAAEIQAALNAFWY